MKTYDFYHEIWDSIKSVSGVLLWQKKCMENHTNTDTKILMSLLNKNLRWGGPVWACWVLLY